MYSCTTILIIIIGWVWYPLVWKKGEELAVLFVYRIPCLLFRLLW